MLRENVGRGPRPRISRGSGMSGRADAMEAFDRVAGLGSQRAICGPMCFPGSCGRVTMDYSRASDGSQLARIQHRCLLLEPWRSDRVLCCRNATSQCERPRGRGRRRRTRRRLEGQGRLSRSHDYVRTSSKPSRGQKAPGEAPDSAFSPGDELKSPSARSGSRPTLRAPCH